MTATPAAPAVRRTLDRLTDGREIIYFDDTEPYVSGEATRATPDTRPLEPADPGSSQLRYDVLTGDWVTIASHRNTRTFMPPTDECPLCPTGRGVVPSEIPARDYDVVVFENRFPSFTVTAVGDAGDIDGEPLFTTRLGIGRCEVVSFTSDHDASFASLEPRRARTVIEAWADRTAELSALPGIRQVFPFENRGREIGVTLTHPHGQIYAYSFVPPRSAQLLRRAGEHRTRTGRDLLTDVLDAERRAGTRVVLSGVHWTAFVPAAARWPFEVHLFPNRSVPDFAALDDAERDELAHVYLELLRRADRYYQGVAALPYIAAWFQAPVGEQRELGRLHLQLFSVMRAPGRLKFLAGSESGMGAWINDVLPERIATRLREVAS
ncbi:MAG TPA: galactose-1-phosphate uridylyltransferase [Kineosporiaceae bacterium]|nr:galactose-1-phosphate uridylyltransferase [Kineosporiaceae bacterium]